MSEERWSRFHPSMRKMHPDILILKKEIIGNCKLCRGLGHIDQVPCSCSQEFISICGLDKAGVLREYWQYSIDEYPLEKYREAAKQAVYKYCESFSNWKVCNVLMYGPYRVGKTTLAINMMKEFLRNKNFCSASYTTSYEIVKSMTDNFDEHLDIDYLSDVDFLIVDEIGKEANNKEQAQLLSSALDMIIRRRRGSRSTILITNFSHQILENTYDDNLSAILKNDFVQLSFAGVEKIGIENKVAI